MKNDVAQTNPVEINPIPTNTVIEDISILSLEEEKKSENISNTLLEHMIDNYWNIVLDDYNKVNVVISITNHDLHTLKENIVKKYGNTVSLNGEVTRAIYDYNSKFSLPHLSTSSLMYNGKKPRRDVALNLEKMAEVFTFEDNFPTFSKNSLAKIIRETLGNIDSRTYDRYFQCIKNFVEKTTGQRLGYNSIYNLTGFSEAVQERLSQIERGDK